jgi:hypothetical protein
MGTLKNSFFQTNEPTAKATRMNANVSKPALVQQNYLFPEFASIRVHSRLKRLFQSALMLRSRGYFADDPIRSGESTRLACCVRRLAEHGSVRIGSKGLGETPKPARETRALPGPAACVTSAVYFITVPDVRSSGGFFEG